MSTGHLSFPVSGRLMCTEQDMSGVSVSGKSPLVVEKEVLERPQDRRVTSGCAETQRAGGKPEVWAVDTGEPVLGSHQADVFLQISLVTHSAGCLSTHPGCRPVPLKVRRESRVCSESRSQVSEDSGLLLPLLLPLLPSDVAQPLLIHTCLRGPGIRTICEMAQTNVPSAWTPSGASSPAPSHL